jgi:hypothetical protein
MKTMLLRAVLALWVAMGFCMSSTAWPADATSPIVGTWVLNIAKSTFDPPPPLKSQTLTISDAPGGGVHQVIDYQEADAVVATRPQSNTFKFVFKKSGKQVEAAQFTISASGKTLRGPISGKDADGVWTYHYVFDRQ